MPCPRCESEHLTVYDRESYECKDCGHLINRKTYKHGPIYKSRKGQCKVIGCNFTKEAYGTNREMIGMVGSDKVLDFETDKIKDKKHEQSIAYRIGRYVWDRKDLMVVDENGNEIDEFPIPKPVQFNTNSLFL